MNGSTHVVKLTTSAWQDRRGLHIKRSLTTVRRRSGPSPIMEEDVTAIGALEVAGRITNLDDLPDGLYSVATCNEERDWETGCIEDYDYRLDPIGKDEAEITETIAPS